MAPVDAFDIDVLQGSTFVDTWVIYEPGGAPTEFDDLGNPLDGTPMDLSGFTAAFAIQKDYESETDIIRVLSATAAPASRVTLGGAAGSVTIYLKDEDTGDMERDQFVEELTASGKLKYKGVWDLRIFNAAGEAFRYGQGGVRFWPGVDRG